jgi:hypothetical protein
VASFIWGEMFRDDYDAKAYLPCRDIAFLFSSESGTVVEVQTMAANGEWVNVDCLCQPLTDS